jgi:hypothetical protein
MLMLKNEHNAPTPSENFRPVEHTICKVHAGPKNCRTLILWKFSSRRQCEDTCFRGSSTWSLYCTLLLTVYGFGQTALGQLNLL